MSANSGHSSGIMSEKLGIDSDEEGVSCGAALGLVTIALGVEVDGAWDLQASFNWLQHLLSGGRGFFRGLFS